MNTRWLMNGNCIERMKEIESGSVDMILIDPPYKVISGGNKNKNAPKGILSTNDGKIFKHNNINFSDYIGV